MICVCPPGNRLEALKSDRQGNHLDGAKANHARTIKLDHSSGAGQEARRYPIENTSKFRFAKNEATVRDLMSAAGFRVNYAPAHLGQRTRNFGRVRKYMRRSAKFL